MSKKKIVPFCPKPVPVKDRTQEEILDNRRAKREAMLEKVKQKTK
ncbi:hypothetical protein [Paenibacillus sp. CF384]|nr:hypothetical protein [Paenibacillus sp. CF384]SDX70844.1 hypothetical protein SAMN05518855_101949 [Paenibacillus sp. CF384]